MKNSLTVAGLLILLAMITFSFMSARHITYDTIVVTGKEQLLDVKTDSEGKTSSKYKKYVYSEEDIYTVNDSLFNWEWYSGKTFAKVKVGTCEVKMNGYRIGWLSMQRNILEAKCQ